MEGVYNSWGVLPRVAEPTGVRHNSSPPGRGGVLGNTNVGVG